MNKYLVSYNIPNWRNRLIVIWGKDKSEVKKMLKRHLGGQPYTINKITLEDVDDDRD